MSVVIEDVRLPIEVVWERVAVYDESDVIRDSKVASSSAAESGAAGVSAGVDVRSGVSVGVGVATGAAESPSSAAIGAAAGPELLSPICSSACTSVSGATLDPDAVDRQPAVTRRTVSPSAASAEREGVEGMRLTLPVDTQ
jgi:hypothetical protein